MDTVVPDRFALKEDLYYLARDGICHHIPKHPWEFPGKPVDPNAPEKGTDLASIPWPLWSLIGSYGRHTLPAIAHDYWCEQSNAQHDRGDASGGTPPASTATGASAMR